MTKPLVIITGASSGIGQHLAILFSRLGYPLGLLARNLIAMEELKLENTICVSADVTNYQEVRKAIDCIQEKLGPVDCLINNAGFGQGGEFTTLLNEQHEETINVNLLGVVHGIEAVLPGM